MASTAFPSKAFQIHVFHGNVLYVITMGSPNDPQGFVNGVGKQFLDSWQWSDMSGERVAGTGYSVAVGQDWIDYTTLVKKSDPKADRAFAGGGERVGEVNMAVVYRYDAPGVDSMVFAASLTSQWEGDGSTVTTEGFEDIDGLQAVVLWEEGQDPVNKSLNYLVCADEACYSMVSRGAQSG